MKKTITIIITILVVGLVVYMLSAKTASPSRNQPGVLGANISVAQQFQDAGSKVGFHVYSPTYLPEGFSLNSTAVNTFSNGEIDYAVVSADGSKRFIIAERASSTPDWVSGNIMLSPDALKAAQWNITNPLVNGQAAILGQAPANDTAPQGHEDLIFTTQDGVIIEIFDDFGYGQLTKIAQSMQ